MSELPRHPEASDDAAPSATGRSSTKRSGVAYLVGLGLAVLVVLVIVLHVTGAIGAEAH